jgi:hypothetical protein
MSMPERHVRARFHDAAWLKSWGAMNGTEAGKLTEHALIEE